MSNLLPESNKKKIRRTYIFRLVVIFLFLSLITFALASFYLIPSSFLLNQKADITGDEVGFLKDYLGRNEGSNPNVILRQTEEKLNILNSESEEIALSQAIKTINDKRPSSIKLDGFSYRTVGNSELRISLSGVALNRESLISFADSLEDEKKFLQVNLPVSNLAQNTDINFSIDITLRPEKNDV